MSRASASARCILLAADLTWRPSRLRTQARSKTAGQGASAESSPFTAESSSAGTTPAFTAVS